jgi:hypothetical protein
MLKRSTSYSVAPPARTISLRQIEDARLWRASDHHLAVAENPPLRLQAANRDSERSSPHRRRSAVLAGARGKSVRTSRLSHILTEPIGPPNPDRVSVLNCIAYHRCIRSARISCFASSRSDKVCHLVAISCRLSDRRQANRSAVQSLVGLRGGPSALGKHSRPGVHSEVRASDAGLLQQPDRRSIVPGYSAKQSSASK